MIRYLNLNFKCIKNSKGQTAIFIALIFQLLFILFAMAINIGLVVHDKINLQNSVDLAAYYAAQKQAEILNAIAHSNYQIRQSWKLLAWRYRVLGASGLSGHPVQNPNIPLEDVAFEGSEWPKVCVVHSRMWRGVNASENLCNVDRIRIPALPEMPVISPLPFNYALSSLADELIRQYDHQCRDQAAYNWWFTASIFMAYRIDQAERKKIIFGLANMLSNGKPNDFLDLEGDSVYEGAYKTFEKNLTFANKENTQDLRFEMYQSLANVTRKQWLPEVQVIPTLYYTDISQPDGGCFAEPKEVRYEPTNTTARNTALIRLGGNELLPWLQGEPEADNIMRLSIGVEKNPWYMAYVGVRAESKPRQIFFPFGPNITVKAQAFAKPFGGRIGPWHSVNWARSAETSSGPQTDALLPERARYDGLLNDPKNSTRLPNYSRFPGDKLGLKSMLALGALKNMGAIETKTAWGEYKYIYNTMEDAGVNDILVWDDEKMGATPIRSYELAAIAPDLFDITYYSIEPNFGGNYLSKLIPNKSVIPFPNGSLLRPDLGYRREMAPQFNIQDQIRASVELNKTAPEAYWFVKDKSHLLTAWAPQDRAVSYGFPERFGKCAVPDDEFNEIKVPGSCAAGGGRTGYSVKIISRDALNSGDFKIGGAAEPPGSPINSPQNIKW